MVDDEVSMCKTHKEICGHFFPSSEFAYVFNGSEALEILGQRRFDVLITDFSMRGMDGITLLESISDNHPMMIKIIFLGAELEEKNSKRVKKLGGVKIFQKPDVMSMWRQIRAICGGE